MEQYKFLLLNILVRGVLVLVTANKEIPKSVSEELIKDYEEAGKLLKKL